MTVEQTGRPSDAVQVSLANWQSTSGLWARFSGPTASAWFGHVPFGMALVELTRPNTIVELGTYTGTSYCGFCEAVKELGLPTTCWAIDTWKGDPHAGYYPAEVLEHLRAYHDPRYGSFSTLLQSTFDSAVANFDDGTIDILHIDGYHTYEAVQHDFTTWLGKLSDRGVVLFHDTAVRDSESFGVWKLWDELSREHPHFAFQHAFGLGVLAVGDRVPPALASLFHASAADADSIREHFVRCADELAASRAQPTPAPVSDVPTFESKTCPLVSATVQAARGKMVRIKKALGSLVGRRANDR